MRPPQLSEALFSKLREDGPARNSEPQTPERAQLDRPQATVHAEEVRG